MKQANAKWLVIVGLLLAFVGLLDSTYLSVIHFTGQVPPCVVTNGCADVLRSEFASVGPVPLALLGGIYYLLMIGAFTAFIDRGSQRVLQAACIMAAGGFGLSLWLVSVQVFELKAFCIYCLLSAGVCVLLLTTCLLAMRATSRPA